MLTKLFIDVNPYTYGNLQHTHMHKKRKKNIFENSDVDLFIFKIWVRKMKIDEKEELASTEKADDILESYSIV